MPFAVVMIYRELTIPVGNFYFYLTKITVFVPTNDQRQLKFSIGNMILFPKVKMQKSTQQIGIKNLTALFINLKPPVI